MPTMYFYKKISHEILTIWIFLEEWLCTDASGAYQHFQNYFGYA